MRILLSFVLLLIAGSAIPVFAQEDNMRGFQLGLHGGLGWWSLGDIEESSFDTESGPVLGAGLGWGMSDWLSVFTRYDVTFVSPEAIDSYHVSHWDVGVRAIPQPLGLTVRPYVEAIAAFRFLNLTGLNEYHISVSGAGFGGGAGLYYFLSPKIALNAGAAATFGNLDEVTYGGVSVSASVSAESVRLFAGLTVIP